MIANKIPGKTRKKGVLTESRSRRRADVSNPGQSLRRDPVMITAPDRSRSPPNSTRAYDWQNGRLNAARFFMWF
jgi:hypothetical protein